MIGKNSNAEKVYEEATAEVSTMMTLLIQKYRHHTNVLAEVFTDQLGMHVAVHAQKPEEVLAAIARRLQDLDVPAIKQAYQRWSIVRGTAAERHATGDEREQPEGRRPELGVIDSADWRGELVGAPGARAGEEGPERAADPDARPAPDGEAPR